MGSLRYMSPELLEGYANIRNSSFLLQADVYSLALLLWEIWMRCPDLFEGKPPPGIITSHLKPFHI